MFVHIHTPDKQKPGRSTAKVSVHLQHTLYTANPTGMRQKTEEKVNEHIQNN